MMIFPHFILINILFFFYSLFLILLSFILLFLILLNKKAFAKSETLSPLLFYL